MRVFRKFTSRDIRNFKPLIELASESKETGVEQGTNERNIETKSLWASFKGHNLLQMTNGDIETLDAIYEHL